MYKQVADCLMRRLCGFPPFYDENNAALFTSIKSGHFDFPSPYWDSISVSAKDLINKLLVVDAKKRYTAQQVLDHAWISVRMCVYILICVLTQFLCRMCLTSVTKYCLIFRRKCDDIMLVDDFAQASWPRKQSQRFRVRMPTVISPLPLTHEIELGTSLQTLSMQNDKETVVETET